MALAWRLDPAAPHRRRRRPARQARVVPTQPRMLRPAPTRKSVLRRKAGAGENGDRQERRRVRSWEVFRETNPQIELFGPESWLQESVRKRLEESPTGGRTTGFAPEWRPPCPSSSAVTPWAVYGCAGCRKSVWPWPARSSPATSSAGCAPVRRRTTVPVVMLSTVAPFFWPSQPA